MPREIIGYVVKVGDEYADNDGWTTYNKTRRFQTTDKTAADRLRQRAADKRALGAANVARVVLVVRHPRVEYATTHAEYRWDREDKSYDAPDPVPPEGDGWELKAMAMDGGLVLFAWSRTVKGK